MVLGTQLLRLISRWSEACIVSRSPWPLLPSQLPPQSGWGLLARRDRVLFISAPTAQCHVGTGRACSSPDPNPCCWVRVKRAPPHPVPRELLCSPRAAPHLPGGEHTFLSARGTLSKPETQGPVSSWLGPSHADSSVPENQACKGQPHFPSPSMYLLSTYSAAPILRGVRDSVGTETRILALRWHPF